MKLEFDKSLGEFLAKVAPELSRTPEVHSFILSLARRILANGQSAFFLVRGVDETGKLLAAGMQTDVKYGLLLSNLTEDNARDFARLIARERSDFPSVHGPTPGIDAFVQEWRAVENSTAELLVNLRLFHLTKVIDPKAEGFGRAAASHDKDIIFKMLRAFVIEAVPNDPRMSDEDLRIEIERDIQRELYFVWENQGEVVCLVGSKRETEDERWIAPVYTPPMHRGHGYGSALTAFVSHRIVKSGKKAMLFTDLANPTSNSIYQKVGFQPVADFKHYRFK